jgi:hypothetical protein
MFYGIESINSSGLIDLASSQKKSKNYSYKSAYSENQKLIIKKKKSDTTPSKRNKNMIWYKFS